jgi:GNAT superfamily N-acetyltransferase
VSSSAAGPGITVGKLDPQDLREVLSFYQHVLLPNFRAAELEAPDEFAAGLKSGRGRALVARTAQGTIAGGAVGDFFPRSRVLLLSYLAVAAEGRGAGTGGLLFQAVTDLWTADLDPALCLIEVEDPRHARSDPALGDPQARVRFYERLGARALPIPYFQPALGPGGQRVPHMMLMVFGGTGAPAGAERVDGGIVADFLADYLEACEGGVRDDDTEAQRLLAACRRPGGLLLVRAGELPR